MAYPPGAPMSPPTAAGPSHSRSGPGPADNQALPPPINTNANPGGSGGGSGGGLSANTTTTTITNPHHQSGTSATAGASGGGGGSSGQPAPPPPPPPSKRDKRRTALQEKYQDLTDAFANSRDTHFRQTVQELQNEMALISCAELLHDNANAAADAEAEAEAEAEAGGGGGGGGGAGTGAATGAALLSDNPEDVAAQLRGLAARNQIMAGDVVPSGRWYASFVQEVNRTKEDRDAGLVELKNRHRNVLNRIQDERDFRRQLAIEEHAKLSDTIRERLVQLISSRKNRLMKDKEHLDIADTSALLLHPNQFSITNPASPGGVHGNRKTRHTRRGAEFDDLGAGGIGSAETTNNNNNNSNKRKRKAPMDEEQQQQQPGSPSRDAATASATAAGAGGGTGLPPAEQARVKLMREQQEAATYSIFSLFTERELAMHSNQAHVAAVHFLAASRRAKKDASSGAAAATTTDSTNAVNDVGGGGGDNQDDTTGEGGADGAGGQDDGVGATAEAMERTTSQQQSFHATRSTRNTNGAGPTLNFLGDVADKALGGGAGAGTTRTNNLPYAILGNYHAKPNGSATAPTPGPLMGEEIEEDIAMFQRGRVDEKILHRAVQSIRDLDEGVPAAKRQRFSMLHPEFPPAMGVHMVNSQFAKQG